MVKAYIGVTAGPYLEKDLKLAAPSGPFARGKEGREMKRETPGWRDRVQGGCGAAQTGGEVAGPGVSGES